VQLLKFLRTLDDLAEIFVFRVILKTPLRRHAVGCALASAMLALYMASGFLLAPASTVEYRAQRTATVRSTSGLAPQILELVDEIIADGAVKPHQLLQITSLLTETRSILNLQHSRRHTHLVRAWLRAAGPRQAGDVGMLLIARGILRVQAGQSDDGVGDWRATLRLARTLMLSGAARSDLESHAVGGFLEDIALATLSRHAVRGEMTTRQALNLIADLDQRRPAMASLADHVRTSAHKLEDVIADYARTNSLPRRFAGLRLYLPLTEDARQDAAARMSSVVDEVYENYAQALERGQVLPTPQADTIVRVGNWRVFLGRNTTWADRFFSLVSSSKAADLCGQLMSIWSFPRLTRYALHCQALDRQAEDLRALCANRLVQCTVMAPPPQLDASED
jgi:hypothetical protein